MKILDCVFKTGTLILLTAILLAMSYFDLTSRDDIRHRYVKFADQNLAYSILDQEDGILYMFTWDSSDAKNKQFISMDLVSGKLIHKKPLIGF